MLEQWAAISDQSSVIRSRGDCVLLADYSVLLLDVNIA